MKPTCTIFLLFLLSFLNHAAGQIHASQLEASVKAGIDPYFIESRDTVSKYGPKSITRDVLQDRRGNYWLANWQGIIKYDGKVFTNYTLKEGLIHFHVVSCYEDKKGNLWFGTARGGVYRYDGNAFTLFTIKDGLADNSVSCFAEDKEGNMWLGTYNGVSKYDGKRFTNFTRKDGLPNDKVNSILLSKDGKLWLGCGSSTFTSNDGGLCCYDGIAFMNLTTEDSRALNNIASLLEDRSGTIWIGTFSGLFKYDGKLFKSVKKLPPYLTYYIIEDRNGVIWFSGSEPNLIYENIAKQTLYSYYGGTYTKVVEKTEPGDNQLFGKIADQDGNIWFGTMKGVCRYNGKNVTEFTE
ncbi:MAG TPA: two-component regulator propeller domain-containing protein [Flavipsychrobacter sp.]|nr:two-component regulator propeller domain-containing protein [Flavipsychrobacter sp.]